MPWLPPTASTRRPATSRATICARVIVSIPARAAATISGLSSGAATVRTTSDAPQTLPASWPARIVAPRAASVSVSGLSVRSEPLTVPPASSTRLASALM